MHIKGDETLIKIQLWKVSWFVYCGNVYLCVMHVIVCYFTSVYVLGTAVYRYVYMCIMYTVVMYT